MTRCLTSTNPAPIGVSEDCEDIPYVTSCRVAWADGTLPSCVLPVCTGQEFDGIAHTCDGVGLGDNCGAESAHGVAETDPCVWNDSTPLKINNSLFTCSSECSLASVPPAGASHDCNGPTLQEAATCAESYEVKSSATALTTQICRIDGYTYADTGLPFPSCVTTTLLQRSVSTVAQTEKFDALDCTNSTVGETCVVGCAISYEHVSGDSLRALTCVSKKESVACLTGSLPACQVTRCSTCKNPVPMGVRMDCKNVTRGTSCQAACKVSFDSANHTELSCFAIGQLESNSVPPYPVCEEKKCVDVATSDSSMLVPDCPVLTSGDHCKVMRASASTLTCALDVVNGSVSLIGTIPKLFSGLVCSGRYPKRYDPRL